MLCPAPSWAREPVEDRCIVAINDDSSMQMFGMADGLRGIQGNALGLFGLGPTECGYRVIASGLGWRLRAYADGGARKGPAALIVSAPIKRPYIWDLCPAASAVRCCLRHQVRVYLIEWVPSRSGEAKLGLDEIADAIGECVTRVADDAGGGVRPFLMGHSLGGTFAAIFAALGTDRLQGVVLLGSPLCFRRGVSRFGDALVSIIPSAISEVELVPGSLLSQLSALASPETFVWSRFVDAALSMTDPRAIQIHARIERWALDEVPLSGKLVGQILQWLYREDRFCRESLSIRNRTVGPSCLRIPTLAVVNTSDEVAPPESVTHFLNAMPEGNARVIEYPGEIGVCLQHLAMLVGSRAHAEIWPKIISWLAAIDDQDRR